MADIRRGTTPSDERANPALPASVGTDYNQVPVEDLTHIHIHPDQGTGGGRGTDRQPRDSNSQSR